MLYVVAGINHFINPDFYISIIPPYLPFPNEINTLAGICEILFAILLISPKTRKFGAYAIILMLIAFIPSHIYTIQVGGCIPNGNCVPEWIVWFRLFPIQPLLMAWAWWHRI